MSPKCPKQGAILISGGTRGLGRAMTEASLAQGYRAVLTGQRHPDAVASELTDLRQLGDVECHQADTRDGDTLATVVDTIDDLTAAIVNAAVYRGGRMLDMAVPDWREVIDVNLTGAFVFGRAAARRMVARGGGSLVFVGTWAQQVPDWDTGAYSASKAGVDMIAKTMALELAPSKIRVNTIAPGIVDAGMAAERIRNDTGFADRARRAVPLGRLQTDREVAEAALFLCSPAASYITGTVLLADGGASLRPGSTP